MAFPSHIIALPDHNWSPNVLRAYTLIDRAYGRALLVLREGEQDIHRLRIHADRVVARIFPLIMALEREGMDIDWVRNTAELLASIVLRLEQNAHEVDNAYVFISYQLWCGMSSTRWTQSDV